jgi:hypothetical protein
MTARRHEMAGGIANGYTVAVFPSAPTTNLTGDISARVAEVALYDDSNPIAFVSFFPDGSELMESIDNGDFLSLHFNLSQLDAVLQMLRDGVGRVRVSKEYIWRSDVAPVNDEDRLLRLIEKEQGALREEEDLHRCDDGDF